MEMPPTPVVARGELSVVVPELAFWMIELAEVVG